VLKRATPEQCKEFEERAHQRIKTLLDRGDVDRLRNLVDALGGEITEDAVLALAERSLKDKAYLESDLLLLAMRSRTTDPKRLARALLMLARSNAERRLYDDALVYYRILG
jgi:hypothetical protein